MSTNFIGSHSSFLFSVFSPALLYLPPLSMLYCSVLWSSDISVSCHLSMGLAALEPFFSTLVFFFLLFFFSFNGLLQVKSYVSKVYKTDKMEGIDVVLSFPALKFLSHTITKFFQYHYFKSWMLLFILQTKNVILQKNATPNVLFNLKKTQTNKPKTRRLWKLHYKFIKDDSIRLLFSISRFKTLPKKHSSILIPTTFLPQCPEFVWFCFETCLLAMKSASTVFFWLNS